MRARLNDFELTELSSYFRKIGQKASAIAKKAQHYEEMISDENELNLSKKRKESESFLRELLPSFMVIFKGIYDMVRLGYIDGVIDGDDVVKEELQEDISELKNSIVTAVVGEYFIVKTPLAMHQYERKISNKKGLNLTSKYDWTYGRIVREIIFDNMKYLPGYREKNVSIIHICPEGNPYIPDSNNRDTKTLIDAVTRPFAGRDNAETCSSFNATVQTNSIKEGTYLIVSKGFANVPPIEKLKTLCRLVENQTEPFLILLDAAS